MQDWALQLESAEESTVRQAQLGDRAAFNTLVLAHQSLAYNVAYRLLGSGEAAADATQDSFLKAYQKVGQFRGGSFRAWLLRIVTNTCYDLLRFYKRHPNLALTSDEAGEDYNGGWPPHSEAPEDYVLRRELNGRIQAAIAQLPVEQRLVLILRDIEGLPYPEIGRITGMRMGTVKSRLSRARRLVRDLLYAGGELADGRHFRGSSTHKSRVADPDGGRLAAAPYTLATASSQ